MKKIIFALLAAVVLVGCGNEYEDPYMVNNITGEVVGICYSTRLGPIRFTDLESDRTYITPPYHFVNDECLPDSVVLYRYRGKYYKDVYREGYSIFNKDCYVDAFGVWLLFSLTQDYILSLPEIECPVEE